MENIGTPPPEGLEESLQAPTMSMDSIQGTPPPEGLEAELHKDELEQKYNTTGQTVKAGAEAFSRGVLSAPITTAIEKHVLGVDEEDIKGRQEAHPILGTVGEIGGLGASLASGVGLASALTKAGSAVVGATGLIKGITEAETALKAARLIGVGVEDAEKAFKLAKTATPVINRIGASALNDAVQFGLLSSQDDVAKMMLHDPNTSVETTISNAGASALLGGAVGGALGSISPLVNATIGNKLGPLAEDIKGRFNFRTKVPNLVDATHKELQDLHSNLTKVTTDLYENGVKSSEIAKALPEMSEKASSKIDQQGQKISDLMNSTLESVSKDVDLKRNVPRIEQAHNKFLETFSSPDATYSNKFEAINELKRTMQSYSKYGADIESNAFSKVSKKLAAEIRPMLEDTPTWGDAAKIQKDVNKAISEFLPTQKDIMAKFTSKLSGERIIDPTKVNTYINQLGKPTAELKQEMVKNYLNKSGKLLDTIGSIFESKGIESPIQHTGTSVLRDTVGEKTLGAKIADTLIDKGLADIVGKSIGGAVGAGLGSTIGHPEIGFLAGQYALGPFFKSVLPGLTKGILDRPGNARGLQSAINYSMALSKAASDTSRAVNLIFKPVPNVLVASQMPTAKDRARLEKQLDKIEKDPNILVAANSSSKLNHYMPEHQQAMDESKARIATYLAGIRPKEFKPGPLDRPIKPSSVDVARFNRALDIAQKPMVVLQHIKDGTILPSDIQDIHSMYPALYQDYQKRMSTEIQGMEAAHMNIPYKTRIGVSMFIGQALDSSMQPNSIVSAQPKPKQQPQIPQNQSNGPKSSKSLSKLPGSYQTPTQAAEQSNQKHE